MSGFSVANNITLRSYYATYRAFTTKSTRSSATTNQLNYADAQALRRAVRKLDDFDFENADKDDISSHVRAFIDTYNYTMDSAKSSTNSYATSTYKNLEKSCQQVFQGFGKHRHQGKLLWLSDPQFFRR